uniref:Metallo-beta-lactamase domain-containing protein n=2 Tax=Leersia perrieri TaxID=77586 RepID=A0A0D9XDG2_9ORYZ
MAIECLVLGAGQEVGKSCVVVKIGGKRVMFDCGMHMGHHDSRRYPEFERLLAGGGAADYTAAISCVVITHFHLDHIGALPYFTEVCGYDGPVYMTYPTKALAPLMLEDYRKVMVNHRGEEEQYSYEDILRCMKKVIPLDLKQTIQVDKNLLIRAYYAGHVLGAAMIYAKVGDAAIVYTGDYNMTPDRHLGAAHIDRLKLDLLITESTYAKTVRDSKHAREREFLKAVHKCVSGGGKVLIPAFALGRAQELCILLDDYWERMNLKIPIYFSAGLTVQANMYYKMLIGWTSQKIKNSYTVHNPFDFKHVCHFERSFINNPGPCVLFATPGMISGGFSLEIHQLSFSPHTDSKGIMDLTEFLSPSHVILVHGEKPQMAFLKERIESELGMQCYYPANNETVSIPTTQNLKINATEKFIMSCCTGETKNNLQKHGRAFGGNIPEGCSTEGEVEGILLMEKSKIPKILCEDELLHSLGMEKHLVHFEPLHSSGIEEVKHTDGSAVQQGSLGCE